ncbi:N-acetylmuramoyl-L-alanine amidase family protein [Oceanobacillus senegalensis]|uniref:N-acetylmuramoyl-L-alanine amidase family protein n=1 Tax=Oceanobacillus senegalensis TaxID=1936063 RepID=UPI0015C4B41B|nr:N-acetylmuramoyl-L-alanine amidase [Oceanobacillus senegalensis]
MKLYIDPGHGGADSGAVGSGLSEKDFTLRVGLKMRDIANAEYENVSVRMSRTTDQTVSLNQRTNDANTWGADYFVSIHANSSTSSSASGYEDFIFNGRTSFLTREAQDDIHPRVVRASGMRDRGQKEANFHVLRETTMPAILTENGFISNQYDLSRMKDNNWIEKVARAHMEGIAETFNLRGREEEMEPSDDNKYRLKTGVFPDAAALASGKARINQNYNWLLYEVPESMSWNPGYRIVTGTFVGRNIAENYAEELIQLTNWTVYVIEA